MFRTSFLTGWRDIDGNGHMRNTAYLDKAADARNLYLESCGLSVQALLLLGVGPVVLRDELAYFREVRLMETLNVSLSLAGYNDAGSRYCLRNEFLGASGSVRACLDSVVAWMDLASRKLVVPPQPVTDALMRLGQTADFGWRKHPTPSIPGPEGTR